MIMREKITAILNEVLPEADAELSEDLFEDGLDSMGVMTIISMLQDEFSVEISPEDITADNFSTLDEIESLMAKYTR